MKEKPQNLDWIDSSRISVATPCHVDWDKMSGDERKRFCGNCQKNVYNLSDMPEKDATSFLSNELGSGRIPCIQFYRRADGTILFDNCPVALRQLRDAARRSLRIAASFVSLCLSVVSAFASPDSASNKQADSKPEIGGKPDPVKAVRDLVKEQELSKSAPARSPSAPQNPTSTQGGKTESKNSEGWLRGDYVDPAAVNQQPGKKVTIVPGCSPTSSNGVAGSAASNGKTQSGVELRPIKGEMYVPPPSKPKVGTGSSEDGSIPALVKPIEILPDLPVVKGQMRLIPKKEPKKESSPKQTD